MIEFHQLVSVNFQGLVIVFGRPLVADRPEIYFNVLGPDASSTDDRLNWTGFTRLEFTQEVRQVGMSLITFRRTASTMVPSSYPFRVVTDQKYISVVQQSTRGTLYINRFRLLKTETGTNQKKTIYSLAPAWEVRYSRSHKKDIPADKSDRQDYLDPDSDPFLEPSQELSMVDAVQNGAFEVVLLPATGGASFAWQFIVLDSSASALKFFNFPANESGLLNIAGKKLTDQYKILPDSVCTITRSGSTQPLPLQGPPRAVAYVKHEKVVQPDGVSIGVKRAARVMLTQTVLNGNTPNTATIDSAVGTAGTMARLEGPIASSDLHPAIFDLAFDDVSWLDLNPPSTGANPLGIKGPYSISFMIAPAATGDGIPVIGGADRSDPKTAAPFVRIVDGDKLEFGFGNGTELVSSRTLHPAVFQDIWSVIKIDYAGARSNPFTVTVNGSIVPVTACSTSTEPSGTAITRIGAAANGFSGSLNQINIAAGANNIVTLPCDTVDYNATPPTTPNTAPSGVTVTVFGARNEPSSSPVNTDMSGTFHIDADGLTYYSGIAAFIQPQSPTSPMDGSDGLLHLYFQGNKDLFSVAQFSTLAARAAFYTNWTTNWGDSSVAQLHAPQEFLSGRYLGFATEHWSRVSASVLAAPDSSQAGFLNFVAQRVGTYMNGTQITVASSPVSPFLCDITVAAPDQIGTETWTGLPRAIDQMSMIWNGAGSNSPDAPEVLDQSQPYFDYTGSVPAVLCPTTDAATGSYFMLTSVPLLPLTLAAVTITQGSTQDFVDIELESSAPSNWKPADTLRQSWPAVPADPRSLLNVFAGKATKYDYTTVTTKSTRAYGLRVSASRSDDQLSHVVIFVKDALKEFSIAVADGATASTCLVTIAGFSLANVPRDQNAFAQILNGQDEKYPYPNGYKSTIGNKIFARTNGLTADVVNSSGEPRAGGALAYAGLVRLLYMGSDYDAPRIAPLDQTSATPFQSATLTFNGHTNAIRGSLMFSAIVPDPPTDGGIGKLSNTSSYSGGVAPVLTPGVNGGWMPVSPHFSLALNTAGRTNYVRFNTDKSFAPANELAILGDLTVESWIRQTPSKSSLPSRVLTYNVTGNWDYPDLPVQYMIGSRRGPGLIIGSSTFAKRAFNFQPPNLTVQVYVKRSSGASGIVLTVSAVMGGQEFISLSLNPTGRPVLTFLQNAGAVTGNASLPADTWVCVTATVSDAGGGKVTLALYMDDGDPVTASAANGFSGSLGTLTVGSASGAITGTLNGVAFWQRTLSAAEVKNSFLYGFPDNDPMLGIRWNLAEGAGKDIMNSAATGDEYNAAVVNPADPSWDDKGAFDVPYAGRNDLVLASNRILKGWTHVALASRQGHALNLNGSSSGMVNDGSPFNPSQSFALEAWIASSTVNSKQVILEKPGSYSLFVNTLGQVTLRVTVEQDADSYDAPPVVFTHEIKFAISASKTSYVAVNFTTGSVPSDTGSKEFTQQKYYILSSLFIDGRKVADANKKDYTKAVRVRNQTSSFYLGKAGDNTFYFKGMVSHVRAWSRTLTDQEIARTYAFHLTPVSRDGLTASWDFDEMTGTLAKDLTGNNDLQLSSNQLWTIWQDVAQANIYVNGGRSMPLRLTASDAGGYLDVQYTLGGALQGTTLKLPLSGEIDDVRLFSTLLTEQQVRESKNKALIGTEEHLAAYWRIDAGSGATLFDDTGKGNNGTLSPSSTPPTWQFSSAPIQNEGERVVNVLGGQATYRVSTIKGQPSVIEYASAERDAYDGIFSVMKRGYFAPTAAGSTMLDVEYKVGDLDTIFVGQVQSKPSIVGYIEGGPPIPSENQTLAYWVDSSGGPDSDYSSASIVTYEESETKNWTFQADQSSTFNGEFNLSGGFYLKSKSEVSVGLGAEAETETLETSVRLGAKITLSGDLGGTDSVSQSHSSSVSLATTMKPSGSWEPADAILNLKVGRRYIQNNVGIALVKSATADLFMLALKNTQTPVGYITVPNKTIPVDTNIIDFPINPRYIKNGTLDGKVGLVTDPDYPNANTERGSYFNPVEAYAIKRRIEKAEQQLKAYYDQFEVYKYRVIGSLNAVKDKLKESGAFDFANRRNLRSMFNNYVWTAAGGLHKEEHSTANSYSETYTGASSLTFAGGVEVSADIGTLFGGYYIEADVMLGNTWTMTATKAESTDNDFKLNCEVSPTDFLAAPIIRKDEHGQLVFDGYTSSPAPGKVDAYRYMSFLLAPHKDNFTALKTVVDRNWLTNSTTAAANAMREALNAESQPWRVLYRTTYVSRVPADFQPVKDDTSAPTIVAPSDLPSNYWLVAIIGDQIKKPSPTPLEIGKALNAVLGESQKGPGILREIIPWWSDFYAKAQVYGSVEFRELAELRIDLLNYMVNKYEAEKYRLG